MVWVPTIESRMKPLVQLPRSIAVVIAAAMVFVIAGCGGDDDAGNKTSPTPSETSETQPSQTPEDDELPSWANEVTKPGDKLTSLKLKDLTIDIYQVGVAEANTVGNVMNPETGKPIIDKGDDIVYVNYVITNTGPPVDLGSVLVKIEPRYKNWKFKKAMDTVTDRDQAEKMNINTSGLEAGKNTDPAIYTLGADQTISYGTNFKYQKNSAITFHASYIPVDSKGKLLHDEQVEGTAKAEIE